MTDHKSQWNARQWAIFLLASVLCSSSVHVFAVAPCRPVSWLVQACFLAAVSGTLSFASLAVFGGMLLLE